MQNLINELFPDIKLHPTTVKATDHYIRFRSVGTDLFAFQELAFMCLLETDYLALQYHDRKQVYYETVQVFVRFGSVESFVVSATA